MRAICAAVRGSPLFSRPLAAVSFSLSKLWRLMMAVISSTHWSVTVAGSSTTGGLIDGGIGVVP